MKIVILAGGKGRRMCAESTNLPKPLVTIGGIPIICHIMRYFQAYGHNEFAIAVGYQSDQVIDSLRSYLSLNETAGHDDDLPDHVAFHSADSDLIVRFLDTGPNTCTAGRIKQIGPFVDSAPFFLTWCDGLSDIRLDSMLKFHRAHGRLATVAAVHPISRFGIMELDADEVTGFHEKPRVTDRWINSGYALLEPEVLQYIDGDDDQWETGPVRRLVDDRQLMAWRHEGHWQCMDTMSDWEYLEELWVSGDAFWKKGRRP